MRYVQVNSVPYGSTGAVMRRVHEERVAQGDESWMMWGRGRGAQAQNEFAYGTRAGVLADVALTRLDGRAGLHSRPATRRLLAQLDRIDPDIVHLHNLHGYHVNYELLFAWLAARGQRTLWTLHDCWAFTGHCAHFTAVGCDRWEAGCAGGRCPQLDAYPATMCARTCVSNWQRKRAAFTSLDPGRLTLITPSQWLADLVGRSFLSAYPVEVRHNTIDAEVFRPTPSDVRERLGLEDAFVVLGVASPWTARKGLDDLLALRALLGPEFALVLVGLTARQVRSLPAGVVGLERTSSPHELAALYSAADVLFNPTREDTYPSVNLEAQACGTPVITYPVGGCPETLSLEDSRVVANLAEACDVLRAMRSHVPAEHG